MTTRTINLILNEIEVGRYQYVDSRISVLCEEALHCYFAFPEDTRRISIILSDSPLEEGYIITSCQYNVYGDLIGDIETIFGVVTEHMYAEVGEVLIAFGLPVYVALEY